MLWSVIPLFYLALFKGVIKLKCPHSWPQVNVTWPGSLCSELQTGSYCGGTWWSAFGENRSGCISAAPWQQCSARGRASPPTADTGPPSGKSNTQTQKSQSNSIYFLCVIHLALFCPRVCYWESSPCWLPADTSRSWPDRACGAWWHSFLRLQVEDPSGRAALCTCAHIQYMLSQCEQVSVWM